MPLDLSPDAPELLRLALRSNKTHAIVLLDADARIVAWLAGAERLFGYSEDEVLGQDISILFTSEDVADDLAASEARIALSASESEDDRWHVRKDGGRVWVSGTLTALRDEHGNHVGFCKILRNRSDQKTQVETLEGRIESLREGHERKNNFISTLAHELRNPLAAMANAVELLSQRGPLAAEHIGFAAGIVSRQVEFMRRMIDDLLDLAGSATGKITVSPERVTLQDVVEAAIEVGRAAVEARRHRLHRLMPEEPIVLLVDPVRMRQVVVNLIENASKYTAEGGNIWVKMTREADEAVIRVQDDGVGIAPDMLTHIFDLFTQVEHDGGPKSGLGIGLSVVKDCVGLHGGTVQAVSDGLGKGSELIVRLPMPGQPHRRPEFGKG